MKGREKDGIVDPSQGDALVREIRDKLLAVRDPKDNSQVITRIDLASEVYQGPTRIAGRTRWLDTTADIAQAGRRFWARSRRMCSRTIPIRGAAITAWITQKFRAYC